MAVAIDLSKAFDTLQHNILITKFDHYGIRGTALKWIDSCLSNRQQYVKLNNKCSKTMEMTMGTTQGSVNGPLFFSVYINDVIQSLIKSNCVLFADDNTLYISRPDPTNLAVSMTQELWNIKKWFDLNKLSMNVEKKQCILFRGHMNNVEISVKLNGMNITQTDTLKLLGIHLDSEVNWSKHINMPCNELSKVK